MKGFSATIKGGGTMTKIEAHRFGSRAYTQGLNRVPVADRDFMRGLEKAKKVNPLLESWLRGWDNQHIIDELGFE